MPQDIRNIAIIAHVDHGKTTLVDAMLKQSHIFRENQQVGELIMDSNELEREKGITILAKNTAITYRGTKINIIDTPGHADFSGEVERVLNMADGCLLVVDAVDGPMPQTRFVLRQALRKGLQPVVMINKADRPQARPEEVTELVQDLFLELATHEDQLDFPILYGSAKDGYAASSPKNDSTSLEPLLEEIIGTVSPPPGDPQGDFQLLVAARTYDSHLGHIGIGRIVRGTVTTNDSLTRISRDGATQEYKVAKVFVYEGLARKEVDQASAGEIVAINLAGAEDIAISDTLASTNVPEALPAIDIGEPTVQMTFGVNTSPFAGQDGKFVTSRQLGSRLYSELKTNVGLRVTNTQSPDVFLVSGRGELHLAILVETMRREGYEFHVSKPEAIIKLVDKVKVEPYERLILDVGDTAIGILTQELSARLGRMTDMRNDGRGEVMMEFKIPTRGLIGFRSFFLQATRGNGIMNTEFIGYEQYQGALESTRNGVLVAAETGTAVTYGLNNAQQRGMTFVDPGTPVYEGMVVGSYTRDEDIVVNVCKMKQLTNVRSSTADMGIKLTPPVRMSLEECLDFIVEDEVVEVTPKNIRLRKRILRNDERYRTARDKNKKRAGSRS